MICLLTLNQHFELFLISIRYGMKVVLILFFAALCWAQNEAYSESLSLKSILLSKATYDINAADQIANRCSTCYPGFTPLKQILGNKILALVGVDTEIDSIFVVFRGSSNFLNWVTDSNIIKSTYNGCPDCQVHSGFHNSYKRLVKEGLEDAIQEAVRSYPGYSVIFTGHSLGGAVANLASASFILQFPNSDVKLYTFGQPRVGNAKYAEYLDKLILTSYRVAHKKDIVPHKPAYNVGYRHSGIEIWYKDGMAGSYIKCVGESNDCSNGLGSYDHNFNPLHHSSKYYVQIPLRTKRGATPRSARSESPAEESSKIENYTEILKDLYEQPNDLFEGDEEM